MQTDDPTFIRQLQKQDPEAFRILLDEYDRRVYSIVYRMIPHREDIEDVAQEAFVEIWRALPRFRHDARLSTWIHRIATNVCLEHRRKKRGPENISLDEMLPVFEGPEESTEALVERNDLKDRVRQCVGQLPEIYRQVIVLHELQGYTYREVAKMLRLPEGTVKSRLNAAFVKLRESLSPHLAEMNPASEVRGL